MSAVKPGDLVAVFRGGKLYHAPADMSTVQDTDLLVIGRGTTPYKCTFADWKASQVSVNKPALLTPADGATDVGETPTFTSTAFSGTGATHASSDWQVTLKTDTGFASPVVQSMADTTNLVSWAGGPLQPNTDYIARVRHNGSGGLQSPWSDVIGFKTAAAFVLVMKPGPAYRVATGSGTLTLCTSPSKLHNICTGAYRSGGALGVGVDDKLYYCQQDGTSFVEFAEAKGESVIASMAITDFGNGGVPNGGCGWLKTDGTAVYFMAASPKTKISSTFKASAIGSFGTYNSLMWAVGADGKAYFTGEPNKKCHAGNTGTSGTWQEIPITIPAGKAIKQIASYSGTGYGVSALLVLFDDGDLYQYADNVDARYVAPGIATTASSQVSPGVKFTMLATAGGTYATKQGVSALADNGDVYWACTNPNVSWGVFAGVGKCRSPIFGGYADGDDDRFVLKDDGFIYWSNGSSTTFTKLNYGSAHTNPIASLGSVPFSLGTDSIASWLIIPD